jgi:hypothetical protein
MTLAITSGSWMWYLARGSGVAALVLLTWTVLLGVVTATRWQPRHLPRFVIEYLHRNITIVAMGAIAVHVCAIVIDGFAPIGFRDVFIPFATPYRPLWLGLGAIGVDLLLLVAVTSWLRHRVGPRTWRVIHWSAYAAWLLAVLHALGTGTDTAERWALLVSGACVLAVAAAVAWRVAGDWRDHVGIRVAALATVVVLPLALVGWLRVGPLAPHWASRSGTPASIIHHTNARQSKSSSQQEHR